MTARPNASLKSVWRDLLIVQKCKTLRWNEIKQTERFSLTSFDCEYFSSSMLQTLRCGGEMVCVCVTQNGNKNMWNEELRESWVSASSVFVKATESEVGVGLELPVVISSSGYVTGMLQYVGQRERGRDGGRRGMKPWKCLSFQLLVFT